MTYVGTSFLLWAILAPSIYSLFPYTSSNTSVQPSPFCVVFFPFTCYLAWPVQSLKATLSPKCALHVSSMCGNISWESQKRRMYLNLLGLEVKSLLKACLGPAAIARCLLWTLVSWWPICSYYQPCSGNVSFSIASHLSQLDGVEWDKWIFWSDGICWKPASWNWQWHIQNATVFKIHWMSSGSCQTAYQSWQKGHFQEIGV